MLMRDCETDASEHANSRSVEKNGLMKIRFGLRCKLTSFPEEFYSNKAMAGYSA